MLQESSSARTFKAVLEALTHVVVEAFILENVDLPDEEDSNYSHIVQALSTVGQGFRVKTFKLCSADYGTPQRRYRLFFIGFSLASQGEVSMDRVEKLLKLFRLKRQAPETSLNFCARSINKLENNSRNRNKANRLYYILFIFSFETWDLEHI